MSVSAFQAFEELEQPMWKFWRWGKRKAAEHILDKELFDKTLQISQYVKERVSVAERCADLASQLYGVQE